MSDKMFVAHAEPLKDARIYVSLWFMLVSVTPAMADENSSLSDMASALLFWGVLFGFALTGGRHYAGRPAPLCKQLSDMTAVIGVAVFIFTLTHNLTSALLALLLWMLLAKSFTLANKRDLFFIVAGSFILLLFAASQSKSGLFLLYTALYVLSGVYTLLLHHAESRRNQAVVTFSETREKENHFPASTVLLSGGIICIAALLYFIVPRPAAMHFGAFYSAGGNGYSSEQ